MTALSRILFAFGIAALCALIITPWAAPALALAFAAEWFTSPDEVYQRRRAYRKARRQERHEAEEELRQRRLVADAICARQRVVSVLDQAEHIINTEAARMKAEMPGLDMETRWPE